MKLNKQILEAIQRGINLAIDDFNDFIDIDNQKSGKIENKFSTNKLIEFKNTQFIDLGLPSGTLWTKYNIGVDPTKLNKPEDWYGGYYAWGEIEEKQDYSWKTYKYANGDYDELTKYCNNVKYWDPYYKPDNLTTLQNEDDIAAQTYNLPWEIKMPTKEQCKELLTYTTNEWIENYQDITGLNGRIFTSKTNGNQMFIPAAGYRIGSMINGIGVRCYSWSRSLYQIEPGCAYYLGFYSLKCGLDAYYRRFGFNVRPVLIQ